MPAKKYNTPEEVKEGIRNSIRKWRLTHSTEEAARSRERYHANKERISARRKELRDAKKAAIIRV